MVTLARSTIVRHPRGGGTLHIPSSVMKYFDLEPGNFVEWIVSRPDEKEESIDAGLRFVQTLPQNVPRAALR